jgi:hypothetical protein
LDRLVDIEFIVAAACVLSECVSSVITLAPPSVFKPRIGRSLRFNCPVVGFDAVVRVPVRAVPGRRGQLVEHPGVDGGLVGDDLDGRDLGRAERPSKNRRATLASRRADTKTSMTCPNWSTARYTYRHRPATFLLVPALMELMGGLNWYLPRWLDRVLPRFHVEGRVSAAAPRPAPASGEQPSLAGALPTREGDA